jgi:proprotein convertase subtilisin/kexin type 5
VANSCIKCQLGSFYHTTSNSCVACGSGCALCTNSSVCLRCTNINDFIQGGLCVVQCGLSHYYTTGSQVCVPCNISCLTCVSPSTNGNVCTLCQPTYLLHEDIGSCSPSPNCLSGYYRDPLLSNKKCLNCDPTCKNCLNQLPDYCTECQSTICFLNEIDDIPPSTPKRGSCFNSCTNGRFEY